MWVPPDAVGGKSALAGESEWALDASSSAATLGQLGSALKAATQAPRFFRSIPQWAGAFIKYAGVAVSVGQLSWASVLGHLNTVMRMAEEERVLGMSPYLAILYEDMLRKQFSIRAEQKDPELDIPKEVLKPDKQVLLAAQARLDVVLHSAGLFKGARGSAQHALFGDMSALESAVAKQASAADALTKRAEAAAKAMAAQQEAQSPATAAGSWGPRCRRQRLQGGRLQQQTAPFAGLL